MELGITCKLDSRVWSLWESVARSDACFSDPPRPLALRAPLLLSKSPVWLRITDHFADLVAGAIDPCPKNCSYDSSTQPYPSGRCPAVYPAFKYIASKAWHQ